MNREENKDEEFRTLYVRNAQPATSESCSDLVWSNFMSDEYLEVSNQSCPITDCTDIYAVHLGTSQRTSTEHSSHQSVRTSSV